MKTELTKGDVVISTAGHDRGGRFVVLETIDEQYVLIADGKTRTLEKPKKKKRKHLKAETAFHMEISPGAPLCNADLKKFLKACD